MASSAWKGAPLHQTQVFDCKSECASGQQAADKEPSQLKRLVMCGSIFGAFVAAGMLGFIVVGPLVQHAIVGSEMAGHGSSLGKLVSASRPMSGQRAVTRLSASIKDKIYTSATKQDKYDTLPDVLAEKMADKELVKLTNTMFDAIGQIAEALRIELVTVADEQESVFGDVQLGVDVLADQLMWDIAKETPEIKEAASEEQPIVEQMHADGKFNLCWDPLDGSSIVDNNWAVGTIIGIWPSTKPIIGSTGAELAVAIVALYGPRTTVYIDLDDGVYEFTYGAEGMKGWVCSNKRIQIAKDSQIFSPANLRSTNELDGYAKLIEYYRKNRYNLRFTGGLVPDITQQFTKGMGILTNPCGKDPPKLRLAFEAAPFARLVEKAGGKSSNGIDGKSTLTQEITGIDQRTAFCAGSANEVDRFNEMVLGVSSV